MRGIPLDIFSELFDPEIEENPALTRPRCNRDLLVPRDIYDQIKGNFVYKPTKKMNRSKNVLFLCVYRLK